MHKKLTYLVVTGLLIATFSLIEAQPTSSTPTQEKKSWYKRIKSGDKMSKRSPTSTTGVRGVNEGAKPLDAGLKDYKSLAKIEEIKINNSEVEKFVIEGNLNK